MSQIYDMCIEKDIEVEDLSSNTNVNYEEFYIRNASGNNLTIVSESKEFGKSDLSKTGPLSGKLKSKNNVSLGNT